MLLEDTARLRAQNESYGLKQKLLQAVSGFVRGPFQAFLQATYGYVASGISAVGFIGVSALANHLQFSSEKDKLVNAYRDELAIMLGKNRNDITRDDLTQLRGSNTPVGRDYDILCTINRGLQLKSFVKNIAISAAVIGFAAFGAAAGPAFLGGAALTSMIGYTIIGSIALAIDIVTESALGKWQGKQPTLSSAFVNQVTSEISKNPVTPIKLFEYSVQAHPDLKQAIEQRFNADYQTLSFRQKQQAISMLGQGDMLNKIADDVNNGRLRVSEVPFLLAGQSSPSTHINTYRIANANTASQSTEHTSVAQREHPQTMVAQGAEHDGIITHAAPVERTLH